MLTCSSSVVTLSTYKLLFILQSFTMLRFDLKTESPDTTSELKKILPEIVKSFVTKTLLLK